METRPLAAHDEVELLRAFEPVVRLTQGEYFVPVGVDEYVRHCSLWLQAENDQSRLIASPGELDLDELARRGLDVGGPGYSLSGISVPKSRRDRLGSWFRTQRPRFRAGSRLAEVGLTGRAIDTLSRISLLFRGAVPGGSAIASLALQNDHLEPDRPTYYARVVRDGDWIVCQYWYFYAFNNWRSGFSGVNEHEADWEQVTIYFDGTGEADEQGPPFARWVVFSAHDEVGDDLRRRWDDPDLTLIGGRHPVVFAGAGSHSGAYLAGDYLITVVPPRLGGVVPAIRRMAKVLIPWVRDHRGLWGHDTRDRLGGERGPAGPRYERSASVRSSWADPVGWAGLAKVAPNATAELVLVAGRIDAIDRQLARLEAENTQGRLLGAWSVVSTPLILLLVASLFLPQSFSRPMTAITVLVIILAVEAFARGFFIAFYVRVVIFFAVVNIVVAYLGNWQFATMCLLSLLAIVVLVVNIRDARRG